MDSPIPEKKEYALILGFDLFSMLGYHLYYV